MGVSLKTRREAGRLFPLTAANAWCRSVNSGNNNNFCLVNTDGSANNNNANNSWALAPGFYMPGKWAGSNAVTKA